MANFWTSPNRDPKRAFRFTVNISSFEEVHLGTLSQRLSQNLLLLLPNTNTSITLSTIQVALSGKMSRSQSLTC